MSKWQRLLIVGAIASAISAWSSCALAAEPAPAPRGVAPPTRIPYAPLATMAGEPVAVSTLPREVRRAVVADAARRFKVAASAVVLAHAEKVTWSDGSLGCRQPGQMYTQALVSGFRVVATTAEGQLPYHTDSHGEVLVCGPAGSP
jgi:hypothetical protein